MDDLAFDMYQDPEVAQIIRSLDEKKQDAVRQERYELAKTLKQAIADLQKVLISLVTVTECCTHYTSYFNKSSTSSVLLKSFPAACG